MQKFSTYTRGFTNSTFILIQWISNIYRNYFVECLGIPIKWYIVYLKGFIYHIEAYNSDFWMMFYCMQIFFSFLCRLRSIATHRDHFVRRPSVRLSVRPSVCLSVRLSHLSVTLSKAMFRRRHMYSSECCHYFLTFKVPTWNCIVRSQIIPHFITSVPVLVM